MMDTARQPGRPVELAPATIQRALDGDRGAFAELYQHYRGVVRKAVAARLRGWPSMSSHMDDIVGDVWLQMLADDRKALRGYDRRRGGFGGFIKLLAASRATSMIRRHASRERPPVPVEPSAGSQLEHVLLQRNFLETLWAMARPRLKDVDEALFVHVIFMGRDTREVALELGLGRDAAYQRITRIRGKLVGVARRLVADDGFALVDPRVLVMLVLSETMSDPDGRLRTGESRNRPCRTPRISPRCTVERRRTFSRGIDTFA